VESVAKEEIANRRQKGGELQGKQIYIPQDALPSHLPRDSENLQCGKAWDSHLRLGILPKQAARVSRQRRGSSSTCMAAARRVGFLLRSPREDAPEPADADEDPADLPNDLEDDEAPAASRLLDVVVVVISSGNRTFASSSNETEMIPHVILGDHPALLLIQRPSPLASERR